MRSYQDSLGSQRVFVMQDLNSPEIRIRFESSYKVMNLDNLISVRTLADICALTYLLIQ